MNEKKLSLSAKLLMVQLGSLCLALAVFLAGMLLGGWMMDTWYLSPEAVAQRQMNYAAELNDYVQENNLAAYDTEALEGWVRSKKYVYLALYRGNVSVMETNGFETNRVSILNYTVDMLPKREELPEGALQPNEEGRFYMQFRDGTYGVGLMVLSETPYYHLVVLISLMAACAALLAVNLLYHRKVTRAIIRLSHEVQQVERDGQAGEIHAGRSDEIGDLARAVEQMRQAIIQRMHSEQEAWSANGELITAISHDIRTPLTALIGYLDLLKGRQYQNEEQMERYLGASRDKAGQLKDLTDELFRYFLVFATPEIQLELVPYNGVILMEQLLGERVVRLQEEGFGVETVSQEQPCWVWVDMHYLQRAVDNVFANVEKHADRNSPVTVTTRLEDGFLRIAVENGLPDRPNPAESTRIGLQTCRKILREMGGSFETRQENGRFTAETALPVIPPPEKQPLPGALPPAGSGD